MFSSQVCSRFLGPLRGFSYHRFPSLAVRQEPCRCTSGSASVAKPAPCPTCLPSSPARYALGVGERCAGWGASRLRTIPSLHLRPHQQLALSSSALPHKPICSAFSREVPQGSLLAFALGDVVSTANATDICSITEQHLLPPRCPIRIAMVRLATDCPLNRGAIRTYSVPLK